MITLMRGPVLAGPGEALAPFLAEGTSRCVLATGRQCLRLLADRLPAMGSRHVLMPCYVAEGVIAPFRDAGIPVHFYRLRPDLSPDPQDVDALLSQLGGGGLFVLVHYFGYDCASPGLETVLAAHGTLLLHDAAHALYGAFTGGDFILYSYNKFLPVTDGAALVSLRSEIDVGIDEAKLPALPDQTLAAYGRHLKLNAALRDAPPDGAMEVLIRSGAAYEDYYTDMAARLTPCRASAVAAFPHGGLIQRRNRNAAALRSALRDHDHRTLTAPFCLAVKVADRDAVLKRAWAAGIHLAALVDKWNFIPAGQEDRFAVERAWLECHVLIPVSEFLDEDDMRRTAHVLNGG